MSTVGTRVYARCVTRVLLLVPVLYVLSNINSRISAYQHIRHSNVTKQKEHYPSTENKVIFCCVGYEAGLVLVSIIWAIHIGKGKGNAVPVRTMNRLHADGVDV
jgi:hypothetical protein